MLNKVKCCFILFQIFCVLLQNESKNKKDTQKCSNTGHKEGDAGMDLTAVSRNR